MTIQLRWGKALRVAGWSILAALIMLVAAVQIQQRLFRWRAERLLNDVRAIQMGKSTWTDAQWFQHKWGNWGRWQGSCVAADCNYQVVLQDGSQTFPTFFWTERGREVRSEGHLHNTWALKLYWLMGGRVAQVYADIHVKNGIIWTKSFFVQTPRRPIVEGTDDLLLGSATGTTSFIPGIDWPGISIHPEYSIQAAGPCDGCRDGACTICEMLSANVTPFAVGAIESALFDFRLGCISSWRLCSDPKDLMPAAWDLYVREKPELDKLYAHSSSKGWRECSLSVETAARDHHMALLAEITAIQTSPDSGFTRYALFIRALQSLKNHASIPGDKPARPVIGWSDSVLPDGSRMADFQAGSRIILLFDTSYDDSDASGIGLNSCNLVSDTTENRASIDRGIARDVMSDRN
jgi:hypothetical protein